MQPAALAFLACDLAPAQQCLRGLAREAAASHQQPPAGAAARSTKPRDLAKHAGLSTPRHTQITAQRDREGRTSKRGGVSDPEATRCRAGAWRALQQARTSLIAIAVPRSANSWARARQLRRPLLWSRSASRAANWGGAVLPHLVGPTRARQARLVDATQPPPPPPPPPAPRRMAPARRCLAALLVLALAGGCLAAHER